MIEVQTWNGYSLNTDVYDTCIDSLMYDNAPVQAQTVQRHGRFPLVGGVSYPDGTIMLKTVLRPTTTASRAALRTIFETESGNIKTLIVTGDEGTEQYIQAVCEAHYEDDEFANSFLTVLRVHDDTTWRSTAVQSDTETVTATAQEWTIDNEGDQVARPTITITPTASQANTNPYRRFVAVRWRGYATNRYPVDITNDAWDTAALVADVTRSVQLSAAIDNVVTTIPYDTVVGSFPSSGMAYVDTEQITYTGRTGTTSGNLTGVTRGVNGTVAASHLDNAVVAVSKIQANGDDIRVAVNGLYVDYFLDDMNSANTSVWVTLDWQSTVNLGLTLEVAIAGSGTVETIEVNEPINHMPAQGILLIDSELFLYTAKNDALKQFTISTREAHGTAMAAHSVDADVYWIQYPIEIQYGSSSLPAWDAEDNNEPVFALATSSNLSWDYDDFGGFEPVLGNDTPLARPGSWQHTGQFFYTANNTWTYTWYNESQWPGAPGGNPDTTNPWQVVGLFAISYSSVAPTSQRWFRHCPCLVTAANFQNGFKYAGAAHTLWRGRLRSHNLAPGLPWFLEFTIPAPTLATTWQSWSQNETTLQPNAQMISLELDRILATDGGEDWYVEAGDVTLTFDSNLTPNSYLAPERGNYTIDATLTHVESGLALAINFSTTLNNSLIINTDSGEITDQSDNSSQFQAVRRLPRPRVEWLPLQPGTNTLRWDENSAVEVPIEVDVTFEWQERRGA